MKDYFLMFRWINTWNPPSVLIANMHLMALNPNCAVDKAAKNTRKQQTSIIPGFGSVYRYRITGNLNQITTIFLPFPSNRATINLPLFWVHAQGQNFYSIASPETDTRQYFCVTPGKGPGQLHAFSVPRQKYCGPIRKYAVPPSLDCDQSQLYSNPAHLDCVPVQLYPGQAETFTIKSPKYNGTVRTYSVTCHLGCIPVQTYYVPQIFNLESIY